MVPEFNRLQPDLWTNALYQLHIDVSDGTDTRIKPLSPLGRAGSEIWMAAQDKLPGHGEIQLTAAALPP